MNKCCNSLMRNYLLADYVSAGILLLDNQSDYIMEFIFLEFIFQGISIRKVFSGQSFLCSRC